MPSNYDSLGLNYHGHIMSSPSQTAPAEGAKQESKQAKEAKAAQIVFLIKFPPEGHQVATCRFLKYQHFHPLVLVKDLAIGIKNYDF